MAASCITTQSPAYDFTAADGIRHTFWVVSDAAMIADLVAAFESLSGLYIADGHHRSAAAARVASARADNGEKSTNDEDSVNRFLSVIFQMIKYTFLITTG